MEEARERPSGRWVRAAAALAPVAAVLWLGLGGWSGGATGADDRPQPQSSTDPDDPFPLPPELVGVKLLEQTAADRDRKSAGCVRCHQGVGDPHGKETVRLGCTDCHGGDATCADKD